MILLKDDGDETSINRRIAGKGTNSVPSWYSMCWKPLLSEVISTGLLVLLGCMTTIPTIAKDGSIHDPRFAWMGFGAIVASLISIFGHISGAFMNPSVALAAVLFGKISISTGVAYTIAECVGACLGYGILKALSPDVLAKSGFCTTVVQHSLNKWQGVGIEIALTSSLNFLCCAVWDPENFDKREFIPVKFGLMITALSLAGGPWTGASMNPARSLGPAIWTGVWDYHWVYWIGPLIGGVLPTLLYKYILQNKCTRM